MNIISKDELITEASRGFIKDWYGSQTTNDVLNKPDFDTAINVFRSEPVLNSAVKAISDEMLKSGFMIETENKTLKKTIERELVKKYRFNRVLRKLIYNLVIYGNAFVEIVYANNIPEEMYVLETTEMEIISDEHGEVMAYRQKHHEKNVTFTTDECVHITFDNITTSPWGEVDVKGLYKTIAAKQFLETFIRQLFQFNKFRDAWTLGGANDVQVKHFVENLLKGRDFPDRELIIEGDEAKKIPGRGFEDLNRLVDLLDYYRQQILTHLRVPPIIAGIPDNSNRSNSEVQARRSFYTRIKALEDAIAEDITAELFPKLGWGNATFRFAPLDKRIEKDDMEIAMAMKSLGIDDESLLQYLRDMGLQLRPEAKIEIKESFTNPFPPSRKKEDKSAAPKHETGEESSTSEKQLEGRSVEFSIGPEDVDNAK